MPNNTPPTAAEVAEAQRVRKALETRQATLTKRKEHLEQSIKDLPDDAAEVDIQWFADEVKRTQVELDTITARLTNIEAAVKAQEIREAEEQQSDLLRIYEEARKRPGGISQMNPALRERVLRAVQEDAERRLEKGHDGLDGGRRLGA